MFRINQTREMDRSIVPYCIFGVTEDEKDFLLRNKLIPRPEHIRVSNTGYDISFKMYPDWSVAMDALVERRKNLGIDVGEC